jgi:POT family proton-dependent oligopeptide transporter
MTSSSIDKITHPGPTATLFGHPRALTFLFATEMWERFSYYGMRALLVLYMTKYLLHPDHADGVIGLASLQSMLEATSGPLQVQPFASQIYGLYTGLVYLTPIVGGLVADRILGQRRTVVIGAALMAVGHFMMAFESLFLLALTTLIIANGAFKPNIVTQVGGLYAPGDPRRDRAYSIFYVGINLGAFLAPLVCGTLGEEWGWHYGFLAAGLGMTIGLVIYLYALPFLPADEMHKLKAAGLDRAPLGHSDWRAFLALAALFVPTVLFFAAYEQQGNTMALWADDYTNRNIDLLIGHAQIPVTWFQSFNPLMIFAFTPLLVGLWSRQARRGREPSTIIKMALGCFLVALAFLIMVAAALVAAGDEASWLWLLGFFVAITIGELYLSPISLSLVSKVAPRRMLSMTMGLWLTTIFAGNILAGWLGGFWSTMDKASFFLMLAGLAALAGAMIFACSRPLRGMLEG